MRFPRAIRLDDSDTRIFERAAAAMYRDKRSKPRILHPWRRRQA